MKKYCIFLIILVSTGLCCALTSAEIQPVLYFDPDVVESNTGDNNIVLLMMDGVYRGLCGYGVLITIDNPHIAEFISIELPEWVGVQNVNKINNTAYFVQGTDVDEKQIPGSVRIPLAVMGIHAIAPGYATILATPVAIDDDQKGRYTTSVGTGTIVITGAGPVPVIPMSN